MEKRALIAVVISLIILVLWQFYFSPQTPEPAKEKPGQEKAQPAAKTPPEAGQAAAPAEKTPGVTPIPTTQAPQAI